MHKPDQVLARKVELIAAAIAAREKAYAPYSRFHVGAAVLAGSGRIYTGCNVENLSLGLTICAERVAVVKAASEGEREIAAVAVVAGDTRCYPCGPCLQVIHEFAGDEPPLMIIATLDGASEDRSLSECLPYAFSDFTPADKEETK